MKKLELETIIGLEIHLEIKTKSKLFCSCSNNTKLTEPNVQICPICLGQPGVLPVFNKEALKNILILGLALKGKINLISWFDRKNYFYPDLPKGYQISQYSLPFIKGGCVEIDSVDGVRKISLERIHLEEDTAKLIHSSDDQWSSLDFNRAGVPLMEIVTEPCLKSPIEAKIFLQELRTIARYLNISEADMEKGQFRCDANISLRPKGEKKYFPKTEIKNLNSFKAVGDALEYEIIRQTKLWQEKKQPKISSTRGWDEKKKNTYPQRSKEDVQDYRYFPEPDLPSIDFNELKKEDIDLELLEKNIIELPGTRKKRLIQMYNFSSVDANILIENKGLVDFIEEALVKLREWIVSTDIIDGTEEEIWETSKHQISKVTANWLINRLLPLLKKDGKNEKDISLEKFVEFIVLIYEKKISSTLAQTILERIFVKDENLSQIMDHPSVKQIDSEDNLIDIVREVIKNNQDTVDKYKQGKHQVVQYLIGQVMKKTNGQANPKLVQELFEKELS
ncbi:MAG: Asp-tRNA(Asn)/Glu-tRNA(Gln) amidotransferase subunit GatB [Patescibacteria group bacterium]|nr:Asp-tRNA(Asn)/Glu-tRNA(Gln) amidotransferase subunit GatB [Patescibacteria group bacterium]